MRFSDGTICDYCGNTILTVLGLQHEVSGNVFCCMECVEDYDKLKMKPKKIGEKWYVEVNTDEFGRVLLCDKNNTLPIPIVFDNKDRAWEYIAEIDDEE